MQRTTTRGRGASSPRIAPGRRVFGRYRIERKIGRGGSAEVWLAHDERLDRTVAIKAPLPEALPDKAARDRFVAEARAAAGLSHPAIVPIYDVVQDATAPALVLRYVDGETLAEQLERRGPLAPGEAAGLAADLAGALAHAHAVGLVHRDIKPGNVLVDEAGRAQLVDFGIAGSLAEAPADEPPTQVTGTLRYMAPEQIRGAAVDGRSDLYALGLVLYELLSGRPPFEPTTPQALAEAQVAGPPPLPSRVPAGLRQLVGELVAVDPADRPATALEVEARLRALADAAGDAPAAAPGMPPTIAPGLPAATAGLALLADAPPPSPESEAPAPALEPRLAADTAGETAALPIAVTAAIAPVGAQTAPRPIEAPPSQPPIRARPTEAAANVAGRRRAGHPRTGILAAGAAALVVAGVVFAAGFGALTSHPVAADATQPASVAPIVSPSPTKKAPAPAPPKPAPKPHHHHGHGNGDG